LRATLGGGKVPSMNIPEDLSYTREHEWVRISGDRATVGITDYAQDALGDVVYVSLPALGNELSAGEQLGEVESTKSVSEIYAPVSGKVVEVNPRLEDSPELLNSDPYGEGWLCVLELGEGGSSGELLDSKAYRELISEDQ